MRRARRTEEVVVRHEIRTQIHRQTRVISIPSMLDTERNSSNRRAGARRRGGERDAEEMRCYVHAREVFDCFLGCINTDTPMNATTRIHSTQYTNVVAK